MYVYGNKFVLYCLWSQQRFLNSVIWLNKRVIKWWAVVDNPHQSTCCPWCHFCNWTSCYLASVCWALGPLLSPQDTGLCRLTLGLWSWRRRGVSCSLCSGWASACWQFLVLPLFCTGYQRCHLLLQGPFLLLLPDPGEEKVCTLNRYPREFKTSS